ncbi:twin-arginine translocase TatA/TatE family subunit [Paludifilum halophilum]|uniref:Sec-independent protein translocase protein TatA n=1 Tax=Paludifilum halophilum TaxID=1642702 RepID=A0A235B8M2_9BACL|nr:twin-arginine translocase TatA/TatE family subunit [Paludifilum halophilum]OYD08329.1 twin-arginine translocase TatA/TatE family subunit [Paludifilum halophilum]
MTQIGIPGFILIVLVALILFGPGKLPELGRAAGRTLREFKDSVSGITDDRNSDEKGHTTESKSEEASGQESDLHKTHGEVKR